MGFWAILGLFLAVFLSVIICVINGLSAIASNIMGGLCICLLLKNLIQDIGFGVIKRKRNIILGLISIINNFTRIAVSYILITKAAENYSNPQQTGLFDTIEWMILFVIDFFIGGPLLFWGEYLATSFALEDGLDDIMPEIDSGEYPVGTGIILNIFVTILIIILYKWQF